MDDSDEDEDLVQRRAMVARLASVMELPQTIVSRLLQRNANEERLLEKFMEDPQKLLDEAGIAWTLPVDQPESSSVPQPACGSAPAAKEFPCSFVPSLVG